MFTTPKRFGTRRLGTTGLAPGNWILSEILTPWSYHYACLLVILPLSASTCLLADGTGIFWPLTTPCGDTHGLSSLHRVDKKYSEMHTTTSACPHQMVG